MKKGFFKKKIKGGKKSFYFLLLFVYANNPNAISTMINTTANTMMIAMSVESPIIVGAGVGVGVGTDTELFVGMKTG